MRTDRLRQEHEVEVAWLAFPLHPETPEEGLTLEELFAGRDVDIPAIQKRLKEVAASLSLPLSARPKTYNSRLAQELAKWAESEGKGEEFHRAVFRAYFADGRNIGKVEVLSDLAASIGLPVDEARRVIRARSFRQPVDADWARSRVLGISAVPTFIVRQRRITGFPPYEALVELVTGNGKG